MVQIPEFKATTTPTNQTGTRTRPVVDITAAAAAPFEAAAEMASDVQKISTRFYEAQKSLQRKTEAAEKIDYLIKGDENNPGLNKLMFDAQNDPNTNTALPNFEKGFNNHRDNILSGISDPVVKQLVTSKSNELYTNNYVDVQSSVWKNIRKNATTTLEESIKLEFNQYLGAGGNTAKKNAALQNILKLIEDANKDGLGLPENYYDTQLKNLYTLEAETLAYENPGVFLENLNNGYYDDKIDPENRTTLFKSATTRQETLGNKYKATLNSVTTSITNEISDLEDITNSDYMNVTTLDNIKQKIIQHDAALKAAGLPGMEDELERITIIETNFDIIQKAKQSNPDAVKATLDDVRLRSKRLSKDSNADPFQQKLLIKLEESLEKIHSKMITDMKDNLLNMAEEFDPERKITELDFLEQNTDKFYQLSQGRNEQANEVANFYNVPLQLLKKEEREYIKKIFETGDLDQITTVLTNLAIVGKENLKDVFVNLGMEKNAAVYTHVGLMMLNNGGLETEASRSILMGIQASKSDRSSDLEKVIKDKVGAIEISQLIVDYMPTSTVTNLENLTAQIDQAAKFIFMDKISRNENGILQGSNKDILAAYEQSIQMASGLTKRGNEYYGGWQDFGDGNKILLPQNMINSDPYNRIKNKSDYPTVKEMIEESLTPELLEKAFTYDFNVYDSATGKTIKETRVNVPYTEIDGELKIQDLFEPEGKNVLFDDDGKLMDDIFLETAHDGMYYIGLGDNNDGTGEYFRDASGKEILFNLKVIVPDLLAKANE